MSERNNDIEFDSFSEGSRLKFEIKFGELRSLLNAKSCNYAIIFRFLDHLYEFDAERADEQAKPYILQHLFRKRLKAADKYNTISTVDLIFLLKLKKRFDISEIMENLNVVFGVYDETVKDALTGVDLSKTKVCLRGTSEDNIDQFLHDFDLSNFGDVTVCLHPDNITDARIEALKYVTELHVESGDVNAIMDCLSGLDLPELKILSIQDHDSDVYKIYKGDSSNCVRLDFERIFNFKADQLEEILIEGIASNGDAIGALNNYKNLSKLELVMRGDEPIDLSSLRFAGLKKLSLYGDFVSFGRAIDEGAVEGLVLNVTSSVNGFLDDEELVGELEGHDLTSLKNLDVAPGYLSDESLEYILRNAKSLEYLSISDCEIDLESIDPNIVKLSGLRKLDLSQNFISNEKIEEFRECLGDRVEFIASSQIEES